MIRGKKIRENPEYREKVELTTGRDKWQTDSYHNIPAIYMSDGPHGLRKELHSNSFSDIGSVVSVCYPAACSLALSWDMEVLKKTGKALGLECRNNGVDILLGPGVNIKRSLLCGRNFEYFSEDPFLTAKLASSYITGIQSTGVGACVKHFCCNNQETERFTIDVKVDKRTLHEVYLKTFRIILKESDPWSLMCSYNRVNGVQVSENEYLLTGILRKRWGYQGVVISDWAAVNNKIKALEAGLDLLMPGPAYSLNQEVMSGIENGEVSQHIADTSVERIINLELKIAESKKKIHIQNNENLLEGHHEIARQAASQCIVLLKNDEKKLLPLGGPSDRDLTKIALIGAFAESPRYQGGGSSHVNSFRVESVVEELRRLEPEKTFSYSRGYTEHGGADESLLRHAVETASTAELAVIFAGLPESFESEGEDRTDISLPEGHIRLIREVSAVQERCVLVVMSGSVVDLSGIVPDMNSVIYTGLAGEGIGGALAEVLTGKVNPSGKLAETFPLKLEQTPSFSNFPGSDGSVIYGERIYVGYRWYRKVKGEVLFPFGHGLSFTEFTYDNLCIVAGIVSEDSPAEFSVDITNSGNISGKEVVQVYVHDVESRLDRPYMELAAFRKIEIPPGEMKRVSFVLGTDAFEYFDPEYDRWVCEPGEMEILIGSSSGDIRLNGLLTIRTEEPEIIYTVDTSLQEILKADSETRDLFLSSLSGVIDFSGLTGSSTEKIVRKYRNWPISKVRYWLKSGTEVGWIEKILIRMNNSRNKDRNSAEG